MEQFRFIDLFATNIQRSLATQFQRSFENLDEDTAEAIMKLLNKEDGYWVK